MKKIILISFLLLSSLALSYGQVPSTDGTFTAGTSSSNKILALKTYSGTTATSHVQINNVSGNVGINTAAATISEKLHINGSTRSNRFNSITGIFSTIGAVNLAFYTNGSSTDGTGGSQWATILNSNGNMGIGATATNPSSKLQIDIASSNAAYASVTSSDASLFLKNTNTTTNNFNILSFGNASNTAVAHIGVINKDQTGHAGDLFFSTKPSGSALVQRMVIDQTGNVGIGTTTPGARLEVNKIGGQIKISGGTVPGGIFTNADDVLYLADWNTSSKGVMVNMTSGNVGVGTATPGNRFEVFGSTSNRITASVNADVKNGFQIKRTGTNATDWEMHNPAGSLDLKFSNATFGDAITIKSTGQVGIGTVLNSNPNGYKLAVKGKIGAYDVQIERGSSAWADYVFLPDYELPTLTEVEKYIDDNGHLKDVPSAQEVEKDGYSVGSMDATLLKKIEELTLYLIAQQKEIESLKKEIKRKK